MREPSVIIKMIVPPVSKVDINDENIAAGVIISEIGPTEPTLFRNDAELLKAFSPTATLTRNSDTTLIHAAAIAQFMPVYVCRSSINDDTKAGRAVGKKGEDLQQTIFKKNGVVLIGREKVTIDESKLAGSKLDFNTDFFIRIGSKTYTWGAKTIAENISGFTPGDIVELKRNEDILDGSALDNIIRKINKLEPQIHLEKIGNSDFYIYANIDLHANRGYTDNQAPNGVSYEYVQSTVSHIDADQVLLYLFSNNPGEQEFTASVYGIESSTIGLASGNTDMLALEVITPRRSYNYEGSNNPEYVNRYGVSQYLENVNEYEGIEFEVNIVYKDPFVLSEVQFRDAKSFTFGKRKVTKQASLESVKAALELLIDSEQYKPAFLCPFGYNNISYVNKLIELGSKILAFVPYGHITKVNDAEKIKTEVSGIAKSDNVMIMVPNDRNTSICGFPIDLSLEVAYLRRVQFNKGRGCEFAPMIGKTNGVLTVEKPSVILTKTVRESLLDAKVNSLVTNKSENINYLNKNKSLASSDDVLSEDQNKRLANKINRDLDTILGKYIGQFNTVSTRAQVTDEVKQYFTNNILNQVYSLYQAPTIICDDTNNTPDIIANNKLVVDVKCVYNNTIYEVIVYHRAFDVANNK